MELGLSAAVATVTTALDAVCLIFARNIFVDSIIDISLSDLSEIALIFCFVLFVQETSLCVL